MVDNIHGAQLSLKTYSFGFLFRRHFQTLIALMNKYLSNLPPAGKCGAMVDLAFLVHNSF